MADQRPGPPLLPVDFSQPARAATEVVHWCMPEPGVELPSPDPFEGTSYRGVERLGEGGMGELFVVEHRELGRRFAAKLLHARLAGSPQVVDRMRLEGQALARLNHPNVVSIQGCDTTPGGRPFLVMDLLRGQTLTRELQARGLFPVSVAVSYAIQILSALEATHELGVVHRDVKPDNIFLAEGPTGVLVKLLDFGIARVLPGASAEAPRPLAIPTVTGAVIGTPRFVSPEGAQGKRVDGRADVYCTALVLYTMLAGRGPFDHVHGSKALVSAHKNETPAPPSTYAGAPVPAELDVLLLRALHKNPDERFANAREFKEQLEGVALLLERPVGWLETTTYERRPAPGSALPASPALAANPEATADSEQAWRAHIASQRPEVGGVETPSEPESPRLSGRKLAIAIFIVLAGMLISGMAVVGLATFLRGAR